MSSDTELKIIPELIEEVAKDFCNHLADKENIKILFSGKFGNGKSTFLTHFFQEKSCYTNGIKYKSIHISPVCYSIASNEDILKYIKYDILFELLKLNVAVESFEFNIQDVLYRYFNENWKQGAKDFFIKALEFIPEVGKPIKTVADTLFANYEKLETYKNKINFSSEDSVLSEFMTSINKDSTSLYENDLVTDIIEKLVTQLKMNDEFEVVLIIDDLDRIDPEHIFRILNVFSSHFDPYERYGKLNKFGFSRIILVCDIMNLRSIFAHRYGSNTDFSGYIDKFFSKEVFEFGNYQQIKNVVEKTLHTIFLQTGMMNESRLIRHFSFNTGIGLFDIIYSLINNDILSLREVLKKTKGTYSYKRELKFNGSRLDTSEHIFHFEIDLLSKLTLNLDGLESAIFKLKALNTTINDYESLFKNILYILTSQQHNFNSSIKGANYNLKDKILHYSVDPSSNNSHSFQVTNISCKGNSPAHLVDFKPTLIDYYDILLILINTAKRNKMLDGLSYNSTL